MDWLELLGLVLLGAAGWIWYDSLKARETAISATRAACDSESRLLLDDTVTIQRVGLNRDDDGVLRIWRRYGFEYSETGNDRCVGHIVLLGGQVLVIKL